MKITELDNGKLPSPEFSTEGQRYTMNPNGQLIAVPLAVAQAMKPSETEGNSISSLESNEYGLTPKEKSSIETDINAKKTIVATPAYTKFLQAVLGVPKGGEVFKFSPDAPEYEIHNGNIRANYRGAQKIISALTELLGKNVRLPNPQEAIGVMQTHNHLAGCRSAGNGKSEGVGIAGYVWCAGGVVGEKASFAWNDRSGGSGSGMSNHYYGHSVIPVIG